MPENVSLFQPLDVSKSHESVCYLWSLLHFEDMSQRAALKMRRTIQVDDKSGRTGSHYRPERLGSEAQNRYTGGKVSEYEGGLQASLSHPLQEEKVVVFWASIVGATEQGRVRHMLHEVAKTSLMCLQQRVFALSSYISPPRSIIMAELPRISKKELRKHA